MKGRSLYVTIFALLLSITVVAPGCRQGNDEEVEEVTIESAETEAAPEAGPAQGPGADETGLTIAAGENSPPFPGAKTRFSNLEDGSVLDDANVSVVVEVENFELGVQTDTERAKEIANSAQGQHAHIILDNDPYMADYAEGQPFEIGTLTEGPHTLVVFPSRSYHESVKSPEAAEIVNFYVGKEEGDFMLDKSKPAIIYSRPKGSYEGQDAKKIMLDFYLYNVELGPDGYKAKYTVTPKGSDNEGAVITLTEWAPAFVTGLVSGEYAVRLQLLDKDGNVVDGAFNDTERTISVATE